MEKKSEKKRKSSPLTDGELKDDDSTEENREQNEGPPPLTESELSEDESDENESSENEEDDLHHETPEGTNTKCNSCTFNVEAPFELEESSQVLINQESGEILIFPKDETKDEESWIQKSIIENPSQEQSNNKVYYAKGDSQKPG